MNVTPVAELQVEITIEGDDAVTVRIYAVPAGCCPVHGGLLMCEASCDGETYSKERFSADEIAASMKSSAAKLVREALQHGKGAAH